MKNFLLFVGLFAAPCYMLNASTSADSQPGGPVSVEINGVKLGLSDIEQKNPAILFQARNSFYEAQKKAIDEFVDQYLLEQQAKKENLTVPQLLDRHVNNTIAKDPSEEALRIYYEGVDTTEPYEAVRGKIIESLRQRRISKAKTTYMQSLRTQATIAVRLGPPRADISLKDVPVRGASTARVMVIEYADYECPYCQQIQPALLKLESEYKGKIAFAYKDVPLPMHSTAEKAAEATHCAEAQGKYWEYHDMLFAKKSLEVPALKESARELKLDANAFDKCLDSGEKSDGVKVHMAEAQALGVQGTPTFFINGRYFSGAASYDKLREVVEEELGGHSSSQQLAQR